MPTEKQKRVLRELVKFKCELCKKHEKECGKLEPHRILRGYAGGEYIPRNILMICKKCHKALHQYEFK